MTALFWLAVGITLTRWGLRRDRRHRLAVRRMWRLLHRTRDQSRRLDALGESVYQTTVLLAHSGGRFQRIEPQRWVDTMTLSKS